MTDELAAYERRFRRAGLPLFIEDYSAREDIFTRARRCCAGVPRPSLRRDRPASGRWWPTSATIAGGDGDLLAAPGAANRARGRPALARPERRRPRELAGFVVVPALLPLVFGGQSRSALVTAAGNMRCSRSIYGVVGYGVLSIVRWARVRLRRQLARVDPAPRARAAAAAALRARARSSRPRCGRSSAVISGASLIASAALFVAWARCSSSCGLPREVQALERDRCAGRRSPPPARQRRPRACSSRQALRCSSSTRRRRVLRAFGLLATTPE